jgi:hypothetical protein
MLNFVKGALLREISLISDIVLFPLPRVINAVARAKIMILRVKTRDFQFTTNIIMRCFADALLVIKLFFIDDFDVPEHGASYFIK